MKFSGERLVKDERFLKPLRIENLARFDFFQKIARGNRILDLGCGVGEGTEFLGEKSNQWDLFAIDLSYDAISTAKKSSSNQSTHFLCMNVTCLAFADESFDAIISVEVIEHIPQVEKYLQEAYRILKPGGLFFFTTPNRLISSPTPGSLWPDHVIEYSPSELKNLIASVFSHFNMMGESVPIFEENPFRKLMHRLAPFVKPVLPKWMRIRALPMLQSLINKDIKLSDVKITDDNIETKPTLIVCCYK